MWTLPLPNVDEVDQQLTIALTYANGQPVYRLSAAERTAVLAVYKAYDALLGQPGRDLLPAILAACREHVADGYNQVQIGARLAGLRATLLAATGVCPYCGFGEPTQLDHFLPKTTYGELAIYPRNLVPSCGPCNNAKRTDVAGARPESGLIHPYFQALPDLAFMHADITFAAGALDVTFRIETGTLDPRLTQMLQYQLVRMKLNERYPSQINKFLSEQRVAILMFKEFSQDALAAYLAKSATSLAKSFGVNDWRPALVRSLAATPNFCAEPELYLGMKTLVDAEDESVAA
jgi:hypothetical protein